MFRCSWPQANKCVCTVEGTSIKNTYTASALVSHIVFTDWTILLQSPVSASSSRLPTEPSQVIHATSDTRGVTTQGFPNEVSPISYLKENKTFTALYF